MATWSILRSRGIFSTLGGVGCRWGGLGEGRVTQALVKVQTCRAGFQWRYDINIWTQVKSRLQSNWLPSSTNIDVADDGLVGGIEPPSSRKGHRALRDWCFLRLGRSHPHDVYFPGEASFRLRRIFFTERLRRLAWRSRVKRVNLTATMLWKYKDEGMNEKPDSLGRRGSRRVWA